MDDSNCALDGCRRPPLGNSLYCGFHKFTGEVIKKREELTAAAETIFPTSGKYRLISCSRHISQQDQIFWIRYEVEPAYAHVSTGIFSRSGLVYRDQITDTIEINEIFSRDISEIKADMQSALVDLQMKDERLARFDEERRQRRSFSPTPAEDMGCSGNSVVNRRRRCGSPASGTCRKCGKQLCRYHLGTSFYGCESCVAIMVANDSD